MREFFLNTLVLPMPILWLLLAAILVWRWARIRNGLILSATPLLLLASLPLTSKLLMGPLIETAARFGTDITQLEATIVVPTGGIYEDGNGTWRADPQSIRRVVVARQLQAQLALPLIVAGGAPLANQPAESAIVARELALSGDVVLEQTARNSDETGVAVSALLIDKPRRVILVTSARHTARMSAVLRHHGLEVLVFPVGLPDSSKGFTLVDFLPQSRGFKQTRSALWEYAAIASYLLSGALDWKDFSVGHHQE